MEYMVSVIIISIVVIILIELIFLLFKTANTLGEDLGVLKKDVNSLTTFFLLFNIFKENDKK